MSTRLSACAAALCAATLAGLAGPRSASAQAPQVASNQTGPSQNEAFFEFQVDKPVLQKPGNPMAPFPDDMRNRGHGGDVTVQYVVDTLGHVDMNSVEVIKSTGAAFTSSVKSVLPQLRFFPAETAGRRVRQMVQQSFRFAL